MGKRIIICVLIIASLVGIGYYLLQALAEDEVVSKVRTVDGKVSHNVENDDYVGWLIIPDSNVDYPVMHTPEKQNYYLHRDIYKNYSRSGSLFMSTYSDIDGLNALIYGHNMQNGMMFRDVYRYKDEEFFNNHRRIIFDLGDEIREYEVFAVCKSKIHRNSYRGFKYTQFDDLYSEEMYNEYKKNVKEMSLYDTGITPEYGERLITLSTCSYHTKDGRLFVVGVEREYTPESQTYIETYKEPNKYKKILNIITATITDFADRAVNFFRRIL